MAQKLGAYSLGQRFTTLAFGEVFEATHAARHEPLALLILADELARDQRLRGLLRLEIARAGGLRHPAIARPIEVGDQGGRLYVVYERPPGEPLAALLGESEGLAMPRALAIVGRLASGLDAARERRIAHGALSPSAIVVDPNDAAAVIGVGVLSAVDEAGLAASCRPRLEVAYLAPEQATDRLAVPSADAFALGRIAETLLTGTPRAGEPLPAALRAVLDGQGSPEPVSRYRTCLEFSAALSVGTGPSRVTSGAPVAVRPPASPVAVPPPASPVAAPPPASAPRLTLAPATSPPAARAEAAVPTGEAERAALVWTSHGRSRVAEVPATSAMRACIDRAFVESLPVLALRAAMPVGIALFLFGLGVVPVPFGLLIVAIATISSGAVTALTRTLALLSAKRRPSVVRVIGPVRAREREIRSKNGRTIERHLDVGDYDSFAIDESTYYEIGHAVDFSHEITLPWPTPPEDSTCYEMDAAIVTYVRTVTRLVFDVRYPDGARVWRHHEYDDVERIA